MATRVRPAAFVLISTCLLATGGCLEISRVVSIDQDWSGRAEFKITMDAEAMLRLQAGLDGRAGPDPGELQAAVAEIQKDMQANPTNRQAVASNLPVGVSLADLREAADGSKLSITFVLTFDDVAKLEALRLTEARQSSTQPSEEVRPFAGFEVDRSGPNANFTAIPLINSAFRGPGSGGKPGGSDALNPLGPIGDQLATALAVLSQASGLPAERKVVVDIVTGIRESFRIETALPVVATNAHRKDPKAVSWDYALGSIVKMTPAERAKLSMSVTLPRR